MGFRAAQDTAKIAFASDMTFFRKLIFRTFACSTEFSAVCRESREYKKNENYFTLCVLHS